MSLYRREKSPHESATPSFPPPLMNNDPIRVGQEKGSGGIMKIGIIGAGAVGTACAFAVVMRGCASELVLLDRDRKRARGVVTDLQYGASLSPAVALAEGDYPDLIGADLVMITAGVNERAGGATDRSDPNGRLRLLDANAAVYRDVV